MSVYSTRNIALSLVSTSSHCSGSYSDFHADPKRGQMMPSQNFDTESLFLTVLISFQYGLSSVTTVQEDISTVKL